MASYCYLNQYGRNVASTAQFVYELCLQDDGMFRVRFRERSTTYVVRTFSNFRALSQFVKERGHFDLDPEKCGLVLYYRDTSLIPCEKKGAQYCLVPVQADFRVYRLIFGGRSEIYRGEFNRCLATIRKDRVSHSGPPHKEGTLSKANVVWRDEAGKAVHERAEASYKMVEFADFNWQLYEVDGTTEKHISSGTSKECIQLIRTRYAKAQPASSVGGQPVVSGVTPVASVNRTRTRHAAKAVQSFYYDKRLQALGESLTSRARYKVYVVDSGLWRVAKRDVGEGRFSWVSNLEFADEDTAMGYLYLYDGASFLEFFDALWRGCRFPLAIYCKRVRIADGVMEIHKFDGVSWDIVITGTPKDLEDFREDQDESFWDGGLNPCSQEGAVYKEQVLTVGILHKLWKKVDGEWVALKLGTPVDLEAVRRKLHDENVPAPAASIVTSATTSGRGMPSVTAPPQPSSTNKWGRTLRVDEIVWSRIQGSTWRPRQSIGAYLVVCAVRNRFIGKTPVFDTRLFDDVHQPLYIVDRGWRKDGPQDTKGVTTDCLKLCMSLAEVQAMYPDVMMLPPPLQWSDDISDCVWNPTVPLAPLTPRTFEHIWGERLNRLPEELHKLDPAAVMQAINRSAQEGTAIASRNLFYALPAYSVEHNEVSMMLPVKIPLLFGDRVIAALALAKQPNGYRIATLLTTEMATRSCSLFCDPANTWLKECN